jgi:hypothetical protein
MPYYEVLNNNRGKLCGLALIPHVTLSEELRYDRIHSFYRLLAFLTTIRAILDLDFIAQKIISVWPKRVMTHEPLYFTKKNQAYA